MPPNQKAPSPTGQAAGGASGQSGTSALEGNQQENGNKPLTMADLKASEERVAQRLTKHYQGVQSLLDRQSGSLKAATATVSRVTKALEGLGIKLTEDQVDALRETETVHAISRAEGGNGEAGPEPGTSAGAQPDGQGDQTGTFGHLAVAMMRERGVVIGKDDPELALIDQETQDPKVFMDSFDVALKAKARRAAGLEPEETDTDGAGNQQSGGQGGPGLNARGQPTKAGKLIAETKPGGAKAQPGDYLSAGYEQSGKFPTGE